MDRFIKLQNNGINMGISDGFLYVRNGKHMQKFDLLTRKETARAQIFKKDGKARSFFIFGGKIFMRDFCDLYELRCDTLEVLRRWKLGDDTSSDICAIGGDEGKVYACIRGGNMIVVDLPAGGLSQYRISDASMWDIVIVSSFIYVCCVSGEVIALNKSDMSVARKQRIHKKNIYSMLLDGDILYTTSQDGCLNATDIATFVTVRSVKKAVSNMSVIVGMHENILVTSNPSRNEVTLWDANDLNMKGTVSFPTGGLGNGGIVINGGAIYGSDREGVYVEEARRVLRPGTTLSF